MKSARRLGMIWVCVTAGCAPVIRDFTFQPDHPLHGKRIGVIYSRSGQPGSEGVDDHDLQQFLGALGATLRTHGRNSEFLDMTGNRKAGPFPRAALPDTGFLGTVTKGFYAVPDSASLAGIPDSLDCLLLLSGLSFTGGTPVEDTLGAGQRTAEIFNRMAFAAIGSAALAGAPGTRFTLTWNDADGGPNATEGTAFRYLLWDLKGRRPMAYGPLHMTQSKRFGSETTTFAQDAERIGQILLQDLTKPKAAPVAQAPRQGR